MLQVHVGLANLETCEIRCEANVPQSVGILRYRMGSMCWHSASWPGLLALFGSENKAYAKEALVRLREEFKVYKAASELSRASTFIGRIVQKSPFSIAVMAHLGELVQGEALGEDMLLQALKEFAWYVFIGWGQTKVVEDLFQRLRNREERDVTNNVITPSRQYGIARDEEVLTLHGRAEISTEGEEMSRTGIDKSVYNVRGHEPVIDTMSLVSKATWPTMSAQSQQGIVAEAVLLKHCWNNNCFELADGAWRCLFLQGGTVV